MLILKSSIQEIKITHSTVLNHGFDYNRCAVCLMLYSIKCTFKIWTFDYCNAWCIYCTHRVKY